MTKVFSRKLLVGLFIAIVSYSSIAQNRMEEVDKLVSFCHENGMFNGTILIAEKGEILYSKSLGQADLEYKIPLSNNTPFCVASVTKQFTAMGIMILKERGALKYSDTLGQFFPEFPKQYHSIQIANLMQHSSGLKRTHYKYHDGLDNDEVYKNLIKAKSDQLLFPQGSKLRYSNSGYIILAMIIEKLSGKTYEAFLEENIFHPLGMTNTFVFTKEDIGRKDIAIGYDGFGLKDDYNVLTYGSAGIYSTAEDLFRWHQALTTDKIIPLKSKKEAWQPALSNTGERLDYKIRENTWSYGFGQAIYRDSLEGVIGHSGAFGGFYNNIMKDIPNEREVILLTNNGRLLPLFEFSYAIQNILREKPYNLPMVSIDLAIRQECFTNIDKGIAYYHDLKKESPHKYKFESEGELNRLGYALLTEDKIVEAIKIFQLLVSEFPAASNPYDSLGEAYYLNKEYQLSLKNYKKSLQLDSTNSNAEDMIEKISKM